MVIIFKKKKKKKKKKKNYIYTILNIFQIFILNIIICHVLFKK